MAATATVSSTIARLSLRFHLAQSGRLLAEIGFAAVTTLCSLYLLLCHIPITFMGFIKHPLFTWMPAFGMVLQWLYWPTLLLALYCINTGPQRAEAQKFSKYFIAIQVFAGLILSVPAMVFPETAFSYFAWPLLFGPNLRNATGTIASYIAALICLLPLAWMGVIKLSAREKKAVLPPAGACGWPVFAGSAFVTALIYSIQTSTLYHVPFLREFGLSLALHSVVFMAAFVLLHFSDHLARRSANPRRTQFAVRGIAAVLLLYVIVRKVLLYAIAFNNNLADIYSLAFALAIVLCAAPTAWNRAAHAVPKQNPSRFSAAFVARQLLIAAVAAAVYLFALRLTRFDWNELISSLSALLVWALVFVFFSGIRRQRRVYKPATLALLGAPVIAGLTLFLVVASGSASASWLAGAQKELDKDAACDPSIYVLENVLRPSVNDSADQDFYSFLNEHANIERPIQAPDISFVSSFSGGTGPKPNVFLFVIDALRKDYLSPYNRRVDFTPNIQSFADESVVFQDPMTLYGGSALAEPAIWAGAQQIHKHYPEPFARMNALQKMLEADHYHSYVSYDFILTNLVLQTENVTQLRKEYKAWEENEFGKVLLELEDKLVHRTDPARPVFAYSQPVNVHSLAAGNHREALQNPHPGFDDDYVYALEDVDRELGQFVQFLKDHGMYDNSVIILTADHGESLGDWGRHGHISIAPEIMRIPLIIHLPGALRKQLVWDARKPVFLEDITPTIYYLAGHRNLKEGEMLGQPLFTSADEQPRPAAKHYFMMSSYMPVFGILTGDEHGLYIVDASLHHSAFYDLEHDPTASENKITAPLKKRYQALIREDLEKIDHFYQVQIGQAAEAHQK